MINRGDIYYANLDSGIGSEQQGTRPTIVIQNNTGNKYSPTVIVTMLTTSTTKRKLPTHVKIDCERSGLPQNSIAMLEQIRTIDKHRLGEFIGHISNKTMRKIDKAAIRSLGIKRTNKGR